MITAKSVNTGGLGRFGNQLFTIAGTIGIAIKSGQPYGFPEWVNRDNALFGGEPDNLDQYFVNPLPELRPGEYQDYGYFWGYREMYLPTGNWNLHSHFQDERYFKHCIDVIREQFRMKGEGEPIDAIALHWRAGDYIDNADAYHPRQSKDYYTNALSLFPEDMKVMVFSDDLDLAMNFLPQTERFYFARRDKHYIADFKLMKQCKHFITANSSFSLMAAILGEHPDKKIICPRNWFGTQANITFDGYPENAIVV